LATSKHLQYLSLADNNLANYKTMKPLLDYVGKKKITKEEADEYNNMK